MSIVNIVAAAVAINGMRKNKRHCSQEENSCSESENDVSYAEESPICLIAVAVIMGVALFWLFALLVIA